MTDLASVVEEHRLRVLDRRFDKRLLTDPESARAEATVFRLLQDLKLHPRVYEDPSFGGCDFECQTPERFAVEVSSIRNEVFSQRSGFNHAIVRAGWLDTPEVLAMIRSKISNKGSAYQAAAYSGPRVLAVVSEHYMATASFLVAAEELLTGQPSITWNVGPQGPVGEAYMSTECENAAHIRIKSDETLEVFRRKHALVLLVATTNDGCNVVGVMNPAPDYRIASSVFESVPTTNVEWPPNDGQLNVSWSLEQRPYAHRFA